MDLHRSRSCATLIQSLYDIFVHSFMLSVHIVLGLPRPLLPFILPSISNRCTPSPLIICPKYWHFLFLIVFNNDLLVFILCKTYALVLCSFHDILNILLYSHISKASNLSDVTLVKILVCSINQPNFNSAYIPGEARLSGATTSSLCAICSQQVGCHGSPSFSTTNQDIYVPILHVAGVQHLIGLLSR